MTQIKKGAVVVLLYFLGAAPRVFNAYENSAALLYSA